MRVYWQALFENGAGFLSVLTACRIQEKWECLSPAPNPAIKLIVLGNNHQCTLAPAISIKHNKWLWRVGVQIEPTWFGLTDRVQYGNKSQRRCLKTHGGRLAKVVLSASLSDAAWNTDLYGCFPLRMLRGPCKHFTVTLVGIQQQINYQLHP